LIKYIGHPIKKSRTLISDIENPTKKSHAPLSKTGNPIKKYRAPIKVIGIPVLISQMPISETLTGFLFNKLFQFFISEKGYQIYGIIESSFKFLTKRGSNHWLEITRWAVG